MKSLQTEVYATSDHQLMLWAGRAFIWGDTETQRTKHTGTRAGRAIIVYVLRDKSWISSFVVANRNAKAGVKPTLALI